MKKEELLESLKHFGERITESVKKVCRSVKNKTVNTYYVLKDKIKNLSNKRNSKASASRKNDSSRMREDDYYSYDRQDNDYYETPARYEQRKPSSRNLIEKKSKKRKKKKTTAGKIFAYVGKGFLTFLLIMILTGTIVGTAATAFVLTDLEKDIDFNLNTLKLRQTSVIYYNDVNGVPVELQQLHGSENRVWVNYQDISENVKKAVVAIEDKRFWNHNGVDWTRTGFAFLNMFLGSRSTQGGSTITQQLIKNITKNDEVSINRKLTEIFQAVELEKKYTKEVILEAYLNVIALGNGCNGVQSAANLYFNKDVNDLSIVEAACIVGITQNPSKFNPLINPENNKDKTKRVLWNMHDQKLITDEEYEAALAEAEIMQFNPNAKVTSEKRSYNSYYVDQVINDVVRDLQTKQNKSLEDARYMVYSGGLKIYTELDLDLQKKVEAIYKDPSNFGKFKGDVQPESATVVMDYSGNIKAIVGGRGEKTGDLVLNRATSRRQPGSSMKPISAYALAIEKNVAEFSSLVLNGPVATVNGRPYPTGGNNQPLTVAEAVRRSINCVPTQLAKAMTIENCFDFVKNKLHIDLLDKVKVGNKTLDDRTYSMILGSPEQGVTTIEMAAGYQMFGNGGKYYAPRTYSVVRDNDDRIILENSSKAEQVISEQSAYIMNQLLREPFKGGTAYQISGHKYGPGLAAFGKTGSTNDYKDRYFCGGTPYYVVACWFGYDQPKAIPNSSVNYAMQVWSKIQQAACKDKEMLSFEKPSGIRERRYCTVTGQLSDGCPSTKLGYYKSNSKLGTCYLHGDGSQPKIIGGGKLPIEETTTTTTSKSNSTTTTRKDQQTTTKPANTTKPTTTIPTRTRPSTPEITTTKDTPPEEPED